MVHRVEEGGVENGDSSTERLASPPLPKAVRLYKARRSEIFGMVSRVFLHRAVNMIDYLSIINHRLLTWTAEIIKALTRIQTGIHILTPASLVITIIAFSPENFFTSWV